jgi:hypothetical protein
MLLAWVAKAQLGRDSEAVVWLRRSIEANRNFPLAHFHLAEALALLGEMDEARGAAQAGLVLDPASDLRRYRANVLGDSPVYLAGRERCCDSMRFGVPEWWIPRSPAPVLKAMLAAGPALQNRGLALPAGFR